MRLVFVHVLEGRDVALFLQDAGNFALELRRRHVDALVLCGGGVADARQKIGNWIGLHNSPGRLLCPFTSWLSLRPGFLP